MTQQSTTRRNEIRHQHQHTKVGDVRHKLEVETVIV